MSTRRLAQLKRLLKHSGVTQERVAMEAGVSRTHVNHVLAGRFTSAKVIKTAERLLAEATEPVAAAGGAM